MPYNPGIQDISGQLIAQGMSQAGAARAQAIQSIGQSITGGIKQYQQNQFLTKQALGKFSGQMADPNFADFVRKAMADDPNTPISAELKTALKNVSAGKSDVYDAGVLAAFTDAYQDNLKGQLLRAEVAKAEAAARPKPIPGQRMTFEQADAFRKANPGFNAKFIPAPGAPNEVILETLDTRAEPSPQPFQTVPLGGAAGVLGPTGDLRSVIQYVPPGTQATDVGALQQFAGAAPAAAAAPAIPPGLSRFQGAAQAPAGPMASLGQFAGPPRAAAPAPAPAPAVTPASAGQGLEFKPIPGSEQAAKAASEVKLKENRFNSALESMDVQLGALDRIIPEISGRTTGWGSLLQYVPNTKAKQMAADLLPVRAQEAFTGITQLKEAGGSLGQVAIYEVKLLENRRAAIDQATSAEDFNNRVKQFRAQVQKSKLNLIRARDRDLGLTEPSEDYLKAGGTRQNFLGIQEDEAQDGRERVTKLQFQKGSEPGTSTIRGAQPVFDTAFDGQIVRDKKSGKRYRVVNGKGVLIE